MRLRLARILREPLVRLFGLGALLFGFHAWIGEVEGLDPGAKPEIVVTQARIDGLVTEFERAWSRPPTADEIDGLIAAWVREELMVREALALGLDRDDSVVRRRMQQKLEFLLEDTVALTEVDDAELQAYLDAHPEAFRTATRVDFEQVWFDVDRRGLELARHAAEAALVELHAAGAEADPTTWGDATLLGYSFVDRPIPELERDWGVAVAELARSAVLDRWEGPVRSASGLHLVRVRTRVEGRVPALAEIRAEVTREWTATRRRELEADDYARLRSQYTVRIEGVEQ